MIQKIYIILTYGNSASDCPEFTYNDFKALGINFDYIDTVHCVDNYLPVFDMAEEKKIDKDTDVQIEHIIKNIRLMKKVFQLQQMQTGNSTSKW